MGIYFLKDKKEKRKKWKKIFNKKIKLINI
jgi:hypothetical protein